MNDAQALTALADLYGPGDAVYAAARRKPRGFLLELLDMIVSTGLIGSAKDIADNARGRCFLIVSPAAARAVVVTGEAIESVTPVPDWEPRQAARFRKVRADGFDYLRGARLT